MRSFIAGAMMTGHSAAISAVDRASSAIPADSFPIMFAVAGATRARIKPVGHGNVPHRAPTISLNSSVSTGFR